MWRTRTGADLSLWFYACGWEDSVAYGVSTALEAHTGEGMSAVPWQPRWQGETHNWVSHFCPHLLFALLFFTEKFVLEVYNFTLPRLFRWNEFVETPRYSLVLTSWWIEPGAEFLIWSSWGKGKRFLNIYVHLQVWGRVWMEFLRFSRRFSDLMLRHTAVEERSRPSFRVSSDPKTGLLFVISLKASKYIRAVKGAWSSTYPFLWLASRILDWNP